MTVPNAITRVIDKEGSIAPFNMSRVHRAIKNALADIESTSSWEADGRALKYAELVKDRIHRNFYNLPHLVGFFSRMIGSFDATEVDERVGRSEFGRRPATLFYMNYIDRNKKSSIDQNDRKQLSEFIGGYFKNAISDEKLCAQVTEHFVNKVYAKNELGLTDYDRFPTREFMQDVIEEILKEVGEVIVAEGFMIYREGRIKVKQQELSESQFTHDGIHRDRMRETLLWNIRNECDSIFSLNDWVSGRDGKDFKELMRRCDKRFYDDISKVVSNVMERSDQIKIIIIAGPSCSNKTTTTAILDQELKKSGLNLIQLNIDDYFLDLSEHPKDEFGDYDYEMPEAIDMDLLNQNLRDLALGKTIQRPVYNFKTGLRDGFKEFKAKDNELILIDCLHGLYGPLTEAVPAEKKFKIYTESSNMLRGFDGSYTKWTDVRLTKRMVRDSLYRNHPVHKTLAHWAYVRKGELKHIIPYVYSVDAVLNSGLPYELPILKTVLKDKLPTMEEINKLRTEGRLDAYIRGVRLYTLFDTLIGCDDTDLVDKHSPLREFIGGSAYELAHNE